MNTSSVLAMLTQSMSAETGLQVALESVQEQRGQAVGGLEFKVVSGNALAKNAKDITTGYDVVLLLTVGSITRSLDEKLRGRKRQLEIVGQLIASHEVQEVAAERLSLAVDALSEYLEAAQGLIGEDIFYPGGYSISWNRSERGGMNFIESAQAKFSLHQW